MSLQLSLACAEATRKKTSLPWLEKEKRTRILVNFSFSFSRSALISSPHANVVTRGGREEHGQIQWHSARIQEQLFRFCFSCVFPSSRRKRSVDIILTARRRRRRRSSHRIKGSSSNVLYSSSPLRFCPFSLAPQLDCASLALNALQQSSSSSTRLVQTCTTVAIFQVSLRTFQRFQSISLCLYLSVCAYLSKTRISAV